MKQKRETWLVLVLVIGTLAIASGVTALAQSRPINCKIVSCPAPACEDYEHLQVPPGQCCPVCVHN